MRKLIVLVAGACWLGAGLPAWAFFGPKGASPDEKRANVRQQRDALIAEIIAKKPELKDKLARAPGYATFSTVNVNLLLLATNNGYGMVVDNKAKSETFMRVVSVGGGLGAGIKDLKVLFVFNDPAAMKRFIEQGWQVGGQADATAKSGDKGVAAGEQVQVNPDTQKPGATVARSEGLNAVAAPVDIYQITSAGVALQATVSGTKYYKDAELNK